MGITFCEVYLLKQDPAKAPGDVVPDNWAWARYPDGYDVWLGDGSTKQVGEDELILGKTWKLNAERNSPCRHDGHHRHAHPRVAHRQPGFPDRRILVDQLRRTGIQAFGPR